MGEKKSPESKFNTINGLRYRCSRLVAKELNHDFRFACKRDKIMISDLSALSHSGKILLCLHVRVYYVTNYNESTNRRASHTVRLTPADHASTSISQLGSPREICTRCFTGLCQLSSCFRSISPTDRQLVTE